MYQPPVGTQYSPEKHLAPTPEETQSNKTPEHTGKSKSRHKSALIKDGGKDEKGQSTKSSRHELTKNKEKSAHRPKSTVHSKNPQGRSISEKPNASEKTKKREGGEGKEEKKPKEDNDKTKGVKSTTKKKTCRVTTYYLRNLHKLFKKKTLCFDTTRY